MKFCSGNNVLLDSSNRLSFVSIFELDEHCMGKPKRAVAMMVVHRRRKRGGQGGPGPPII